MYKVCHCCRSGRADFLRQHLDFSQKLQWFSTEIQLNFTQKTWFYQHVLPNVMSLPSDCHQSQCRVHSVIANLLLVKNNVLYTEILWYYTETHWFTQKLNGLHRNIISASIQRSRDVSTITMNQGRVDGNISILNDFPQKIIYNFHRNSLDYTEIDFAPAVNPGHRLLTMTVSQGTRDG